MHITPSKCGQVSPNSPDPRSRWNRLSSSMKTRIFQCTAITIDSILGQPLVAGRFLAQLRKSSRYDSVTFLESLKRAGGVRVLFKGAGLQIAGKISIYAIFFETNRFFLEHSSFLFPNLSHVKHQLFSASLGRVTTAPLVCLIEQYGIEKVCSCLTNSKSISPSMFKGLSLTVARDIPLGVAMVALPSIIQNKLSKNQATGLRTTERFSVVLSALLVAVITQPIDTVKTIYQSSIENTSMLAVSKKTLKLGISRLWTGSPFRFTRVAMTVYVYNEVFNALQQWDNS